MIFNVTAHKTNLGLKQELCTSYTVQVSGAYFQKKNQTNKQTNNQRIMRLEIIIDKRYLIVFDQIALILLS